MNPGAYRRCCSGPGVPPIRGGEFLARQALGIGGVALASLLANENLLAEAPSKPHDPAAHDLRPRPPRFPAQARAMISMFMHGGPSHVDCSTPSPS